MEISIEKNWGVVEDSYDLKWLYCYIRNVI